jgi:hypothetical protein
MSPDCGWGLMPFWVCPVPGSIANAWFLPSSTRGSHGYRFNKVNDCVVPLQNNDMADLDLHWEQSTEGYVVDDNAYDEDQDQDEHGGFSIAFGGFESNETPDRVSILNDGTDSLATIGLRNTDENDTSVLSEAQEPQDKYVSASDGNTIASTLTSDVATQLSWIHSLLANSNLDAAAKKILEESAHTIRTQAITDAAVVGGRAMDEST